MCILRIRDRPGHARPLAHLPRVLCALLRRRGEADHERDRLRANRKQHQRACDEEGREAPAEVLEPDRVAHVPILAPMRRRQRSVLGKSWDREVTELANLKHYVNVSIYSSFVLGICVVLYLFADSHSSEIDLTSHQKHTLSEATHQYLGLLKKDVEIVVLDVDHLPYEGLLDRIAAISPRVSCHD